MNSLIKLFQKISYCYKIRKANRYNMKILRDCERIFEEHGFKIERRKVPNEEEKVYHISFHNRKTNSSNDSPGTEK